MYLVSLLRRLLGILEGLHLCRHLPHGSFHGRQLLHHRVKILHDTQQTHIGAHVCTTYTIYKNSNYVGFSKTWHSLIKRAINK